MKIFRETFDYPSGETRARITGGVADEILAFWRNFQRKSWSNFDRKLMENFPRKLLENPQEDLLEKILKKKQLEVS